MSRRDAESRELTHTHGHLHKENHKHTYTEENSATQTAHPPRISQPALVGAWQVADRVLVVLGSLLFLLTALDSVIAHHASFLAFKSKQIRKKKSICGRVGAFLREWVTSNTLSDLIALNNIRFGMHRGFLRLPHGGGGASGLMLLPRRVLCMAIEWNASWPHCRVWCLSRDKHSSFACAVSLVLSHKDKD